ncbi:MAG: type II toxin-antitoxin system RelE/ParE family toxin [Methylocella sp.]
MEAIGDYIARDNPFAAAKVVTRIADQVDLLLTHPQIGRKGFDPRPIRPILAAWPKLRNFPPEREPPAEKPRGPRSRRSEPISPRSSIPR